MILLLIVFFVAIIYVNYIVAKKFEEIATQKGYDSEIHSFAMCFWLGIVGYLYVIALPNLNPQCVVITEKNNTKADFTPQPKYHCPKCNELISYGIKTCQKCNQTLNWKNE